MVDVHGVRLAVDKKFDPYLDGTVVDYYDGLEKRGFRVQQPQRRQKLRLRQLVPGLIGESSRRRWAGVSPTVAVRLKSGSALACPGAR